jgi:hypothetical protein
MLVFDGIHRHHSKRASTQRIAETNIKKLELIKKRSDLMLLNQKYKETDSIEERNEITNH